MKGVKVEYTVKKEFAPTNQANIQKVMEELKALGNPKVKYSSFMRSDGQSFVHLAFTADEESSSVIPGLAAFKHFQAELKQNLEVPPQQEPLELVGSNFDYFGS